MHASDEGARLDLEATFRALPDDAIAIMCGPMRMLEAARRAWNDAGRAPADLRYETFGSSGLKPTAEFRVRLKGTDTELVVPQNSSMLDALNAAGFEVISDCQRGECGVCAVDVVAVEGEIDHRDVFFSDQQKHDNRKICPCVSRAVGVVTVDTLYRPEAALTPGPPVSLARALRSAVDCHTRAASAHSARKLPRIAKSLCVCRMAAFRSGHSREVSFRPQRTS